MNKMDTIHDQDCSVTERGVIRTLLYFDIFDYPLTLEEIIKFHPELSDRKAITRAVASLQYRAVLFNHYNFYALRPDAELIQKRVAGNKLAVKRMKTAKKFSRLISFFPFVRAIMLSGSLSKNYMSPTSDIDYFLITKPGRLWLVRGMLAIFKRIFLFNSHKFFCVNYLIDAESLEIEDRNLFTAIETTTLIPVHGKKLFEKFIEANNWTKNYLPNVISQQPAYIQEPFSPLKRWLEKILDGPVGERLDVVFMNLAIKRWKRQFGDHYSAEEFELAFRSRRNVSKNHPRLFQKHTLQILQERIDRFETLSKMKLSA